MGTIEAYLVERLVLAMRRVQRAGQLEAECITAAMNPPITKTEGGQAHRRLFRPYSGPKPRLTSFTVSAEA